MRKSGKESSGGSPWFGPRLDRLMAIMASAVLSVALAGLLITAWPGAALADVYFVTNLNDSGAGSLRQAVTNAADGDSVIFDPGLSGTITLGSNLPSLESVTFTGGKNVTVVRSGPTMGLYGLYGGTVGSGETLGGDLAMDIQAEGTGNFGNAYGLLSLNDLTVTTLSGSVSATVDTHHAYGLFSLGDQTVNYLSGSVAATAGTSDAYGLYNFNGAIHLTTLSGTVSATAGTDYAYGLRSGGGLTVNYLTGTVTATAGVDIACGLLSSGDLTMTGLSGTVSANAGNSYAYGLRSSGGLTVNYLTGTVLATTGTNKAFGLLNFGDLTVTTLSGSVSATAGGYGAFGVYSAGTLDDGAGGAAEISGTVTAQADGLAVGVSAGQGMKLNVTGTISATDTSGGGDAYAIAAGTRDGSGGWVLGGNFDDDVTLGSGASITGDINLGGGTNTLVLDGWGSFTGDTANITTLDKNGAGAWTTSGSVNAAALNVNSGTLQVDVSQLGAASVTVAGAVANNGEIHFNPSIRMAPGTAGTVLTSGGGLAGTGTYTSSPFLTITVGANTVDLSKRSFTDVFTGTEDTWEQIAAGLDAEYATAGGELAALILALEQSSSQAEAEETMDQINTLLLAQGMDLSLGAARLLSSATQGRMAEMRDYQTYLAGRYDLDPDDPSTWPMVAALGDLSGLLYRTPDNDPNGVYLRATGRTGDMDAHGGQSGYDYDSLVLSGGYDRVIQDELLLGLSLAYSTTDADYKDDGGSSSELDSYTLGVYASLFHEAWYLDLVLSTTWNDYDLKRELPALGSTATADPTGHTLTAKTEGGWRFESGDWGLTPRASLEYTSFHQDGYTETGAGAANLVMDDTDEDFLESGLGGTVDRTWKTGFGLVIPEVSAMWLHEWLTQDQEVTYSLTGMPDTVLSQTMAESSNDSLRLGAGMRFVLDDEGLILTTRYQGDFEEHGRSHSLLMEAQWVF